MPCLGVFACCSAVRNGPVDNVRQVSETWNGVLDCCLPLQQVEMRNLLVQASRARQMGCWFR